MQITFQDSVPIKLSSDVFRLYQYCSITNEFFGQNYALLVEDGLFELTFIKQSDIMLQVQNKKPVKLPPCFSLGKLPLPYKFIVPKKLDYFSIKVQPWATSLFFPDVFNLLDLCKFYDPDILDLHRQIFKSNSFDEMTTRVEKYFEFKIPIHSAERSISKSICQHIYNRRGDLKIKELLNEFPQSRQKTNKDFYHQTKNSIKEFAGYVRIREILNDKEKNKHKSWTTIAMDYGYFDQAHLTNDLKKATGLSPSKFISQNIFFQSS
jgi:AraC-like DNA-binding protein